jgi:hypothetical protein
LLERMRQRKEQKRQEPQRTKVEVVSLVLVWSVFGLGVGRLWSLVLVFGLGLWSLVFVLVFVLVVVLVLVSSFLNGDLPSSIRHCGIVQKRMG